MPQRTIADAAFALENLPGLSDCERHKAEAELAQARQAAVVTANEMADGRVAEIAGERDAALAELCAVRDAYRTLTSEAQLGRMTAAECDRQLNALRARQRNAERLIARTDEAIAFVESIEADPVAYGDALYAKYPLIRPTFSF